MSPADLKAALMKLAEDWDAEAQVAQSDAERETLLGAAAELRECLAEAAPAPPTPDLKADLLRLVDGVSAIGDASSLRARLQAARVTEPPASKEEKNPKWPRAVVNNALDILEIRATNAGDVALAQHARQVLEEMSDPAPQAPPPDPCVVKCGNMSTCRDEPHLCIRAINLSRAYITREEAAALIPALQAFVAEGGQ